jgi:CubicO group peptidase (beta-lactamase class C family)
VPANRAIPARDPLTSTWGFGMQGATFGAPQPEIVPGPDTWIGRLGELSLLRQPGEKWLYQSGAQVLGVLIAPAAGQRFDDVMRDRLSAPLGMTDAGFFAHPPRLATAYARRDGRRRRHLRPDAAAERAGGAAPGHCRR